MPKADPENRLTARLAPGNGRPSYGKCRQTQPKIRDEDRFGCRIHINHGEGSWFCVMKGAVNVLSVYQWHAFMSLSHVCSLYGRFAICIKRSEEKAIKGEGNTEVEVLLC